MFRRNSICDGHDASYLFDQGAVSFKHLGHFYLAYVVYAVSGIQMDIHKYRRSERSGCADRQTDCRFVANSCDHIHADHDP